MTHVFKVIPEIQSFVLTNDNIPAPMTLTEFFFFETVRRNDLVKDVSVFKTILSTLV